MAIDAGIFANALRAPPTVADFDAQNQAFQQNALQLQTARQAMTDQNSLRQATMQFGSDPTANRALLAGTGNYKAVQDFDKSQRDAAESRSKIGLDAAHVNQLGSQVDSAKLADKIKASDFHLQQLGGITDISQIPGWVADGVSSGVQDFSSSKQGLQQFIDYAQKNGLEAAKAQALKGGTSATEQLKLQQAKLLADQQNATSIANNTATNQAHLQATGMSNATSRANNAATIAKDYKVAGIDPQTGNFVGAGDGAGGGMAGMVDALGTYKMDPSQAFARMAPAMRAGVISQVQAKYPEYDPTTYSAKTKASRDFSTGSQGNAMRSFAVAGQHLDQLGTLVDALDNGNVQLINKVGNKISEQFGGTAPTNFDAAKDVVSKEVVKAIVAGGGGVNERKELADLMGNAKTPAQLKGVIQQYRGLMSAQHDALLTQRRAAGLSDNTLPKYTDANGSPAAAASTLPPDIAAILQKHGAK